MRVVAVALLLAGLALAPLEMGVTRVVGEIDIARSPAEVFDYVTTPLHWPQWHPSSLAVSGDAAHALTVGESVQEDFLVAGRRGRATWRVAACEPARHWRIEGDIDGRHAGTVSYSLSATAAGTHFVREFSYPSRSLLFALLNGLSLRRRIDAESALALARLKTVLEATPER